MPAHRVPTDLKDARFPNNWTGIRSDGASLDTIKIKQGTPTGTPDAHWAFDISNGIMYCGTSGSWVAQTPGASGGTVPGANYATDTLKVNSIMVDPLVHVGVILSGGSTTPSPGPMFFATRGYTMVSARLWVTLGTNGITTVTIYKTVVGTALGSGTAMTDGLGLAAASANSATSFTPVTAGGANTLAAGDVMGWVGSGGTASPMGGNSVALIDVVLKPTT